MVKSKLVIQHDLSKLSVEQLTQYLRDVSEFIGLDPDLNGLDTIWMQNENGPGQSLVVYARRGTAEILRNLYGIEISSLTNQMVKGAIVFTATGKNSKGRQEIAVGSKNIESLQGKAQDDAIMTASTRALRRVTMQFTSLGILDESEVTAIKGSGDNPATSAMLLGGAVVIPPMPIVSPNNAPGLDVTNVPCMSQAPILINGFENSQQLFKEGADALAAMPTPSILRTEKPKRARKRNTVNMDGPEAEVVSNPAPVSEPRPEPAPALTVPISVAMTYQPTESPAVPAPLVDPNIFAGKPTDVQMTDYRKRVGMYTAELPSSENMGSVQKMRAFITKMSGSTPQTMTTDQWEEMLSWFEGFVGKNQMKGLVKYINDSLGVK